MKKLLFIIPFIINALCIAPIYALCAPGDSDCTRPTGGKPVGKCDKQDDKAGTVCTTRVNGATFAECRPNNRAGTLSCTSLCCAQGYYLKHNDDGVSYGYCVTEREAIKDCERCKGGNCEPVLLENQPRPYKKWKNSKDFPCTHNLFLGCQPKQSTPIPEPEVPQNNDTEEPVPPETNTPTQNPPTKETGCTLYFDDDVKISGVQNAKSAKKSFRAKYTTITTNESGPNIATYYKNDKDTIFKQNYDTGNGTNYDPAIHHLFNIIKIEKNGESANIDLTGLSSATYAEFECNSPSITLFDTVDPQTQTPPSPSQPTIISSGTTCTQSGCFNPSVFVYMDMMIDTYFNTKASVWKNDEGTFNTKRLIADSAASVVLGTIGGVVTSNIVKKNQIQQGFETLKCTIGGQDVASFGDEFWVGIQ